jgi:hypothetical protein
MPERRSLSSPEGSAPGAGKAPFDRQYLQRPGKPCAFDPAADYVWHHHSAAAQCESLAGQRPFGADAALAVYLDRKASAGLTYHQIALSLRTVPGLPDEVPRPAISTCSASGCAGSGAATQASAVKANDKDERKPLLRLSASVPMPRGTPNTASGKCRGKLSERHGSGERGTGNKAAARVQARRIGPAAIGVGRAARNSCNRRIQAR